MNVQHLVGDVSCAQLADGIVDVTLILGVVGTQIAAGLVATVYKQRSEWDFDLVWMEGLGRSGNNARYDVSWQYRLTPSEYPEWGIPTEWQSVVELGGRYAEGSEMVHQLTVGALWVHPSWVLEAGVIRDLNGPDTTSFLVGIRKHF